MQEMQVQPLSWEDLLEKEMATHSSILTWKIPWMEEPGRLQSMGSQRVGHWVTSLSLSLFFLELFLHWFPVAYWAPTYLGSSSFSVLSLCLFILFLGFSRQEYWSGLPVPSPVDHILLELSTMTRLSWVALHRMGHSFIELDKLYTVSKNKTGSWLWLTSWTPYCQIQTEIEESRENH